MRGSVWWEGDERDRKMRTICDACESAPAVIFCAADEASLCRTCDEKVFAILRTHSEGTGESWTGLMLTDHVNYRVHLCNKLAYRHVRVGLANPSEVPRCNICENAPGFFYCEIDGSSLCLQCDMIVHVGRKRTHERYLLLRQRVEFPGGKTEQVEVLIKNPAGHSRDQKFLADPDSNMNSITIDLNSRPVRFQEQASSSQAHQMDTASDNDREPPCVVPTGPLPSDG